MTTTTVLDQTFNDVDLVGRPLSIGNFVDHTLLWRVLFTSTTNTYTPYLDAERRGIPESDAGS